VDKKIKLAVIGSPIKHSKSPEIHYEFSAESNIQIAFDKFEVTKENCNTWIKNFFDNGGKGLSITLPLKEECLKVADVLSTRSQISKAANVLYKKKGKIIADCTDGTGLVNDLTMNKKILLENKSILVIGAGGAARGIIPSFILESPKKITVANRTLEKAERLIAELAKIESLSSKSSILIASGLKPEDLKDQHFDIVINATSVSTDPTLNLNLDKNIFTNASVALDLYYSQAFTSFMESAREASVPLIIDGWGMLVEQAAESFLLWTGTKPSTAVLVAKHGE
jgi:shikimate dehydrogenase|tara:strand:+ start:3198 stop:4046 length:849 start_codon:yes stop_codon:yes gene_type:complete